MAQKPRQTGKRSNSPSLGPIVSSAHLARATFPGLSEVEYGLILASHAFSRWIVRCMQAAGYPGLSPIEVLILHTIRHRGRAKTLADICLVLAIEDTHVATYAIKKLEAADLVATGKSGKEKTVEITAKGSQACDRYAQIREELLLRPAMNADIAGDELSHIAAVLRLLSGSYEQAARAAATV